jgi:predicted nucleic acid-binding protein
MPFGPSLAETSLVIDNDLFTHWRNRQAYVLRQIVSYMERLKQPPALTSITVFEARWGLEAELAKATITADQGAQYGGRIDELIGSCTPLSFDNKAASIAAYVFSRLSRDERRKHWKDLFTAATALAHGYGVATGNRTDFELIGGHLASTHPILRLAIWRP